MEITIAKSIYPKTAVLKAAYQFTDRAYIYVQPTAENYIISFKPKQASDEVASDEFMNELLAQTVRYELFLQTKDIRKLIAMRALASTIVGEQEEVPVTSQTFQEDDILKDWFEHEDTTV